MTTTTTPLRFQLATDTIDEDDIRDLVDWLQGNPWLTMGPLTRQFEQAWADWLGTRYAVYVNSGSSANLLMYDALALSGRLRNRKVIVPAVAWATTLAPAIQLGLEPILCDADERTFGLDLDHLETLCRRHEPAAVMMVHVLGVPHRMDELTALQHRHGFELMEDTCAATGSRFEGQKVGTFGALSTFSLYFGHHISTIEGGLVCTDDEQLRDILLQIRSHGWAKDLEPHKEQALVDRYGILDFNRRFAFYHPGYNVRPTDLGARIGLRQMQKIDRVVARRVENHRVYQARFAESDRFICQENPDAEISSISFAALATDEQHRDRVAQALAAAGVETRPLGGGSMGRQPFWTERHGTAPLPFADRIHTTSFHLPNNPEIGPADIEAICDVVLEVE